MGFKMNGLNYHNVGPWWSSRLPTDNLKIIKFSQKNQFQQIEPVAPFNPKPKPNLDSKREKWSCVEREREREREK